MTPDPRLLRAQRFPLHAAVEDGNLQNVLLVLKTEKSRINKKFEDSQQTALHVASSNATKDIVRELLKAGANIDEEDVVRQTALHYSVNNRDAGVLDLLIQEGAKIDPRRCRDGWTPLFIAAIFGNAKATRSLVNSGADVLLADNQGKGAEDWAANYRQHEVCKILRAAPRKVTETSGQVYVDTGPVQPKKEVEFDAGMNLLMKKIEEKRKARLAKPKSAEQKKLDNERLNERISEVKEEVELVVHKLKDQDPKEKEKTEEDLKKIEEAKRMLSQKRMERILEKERQDQERLKAQREDEEKSQKEQELTLKRAEEEKLKSQQDEEEKIRKEKEKKEKIQLQKEKEEKLRIQKEKEDEEKKQKAIEQKKLKELEEFRRKEEEKEIKRLEKEKRINAKQKKLEEEKENKKRLEEMKQQELERLKSLKEERERLRLEEESKLREKQKLKELEEKERLEKEKQRAKEMAEKLELEKKKQLEELEKQKQEREKQIKEEKEKIRLEEEIKLKEKKKKLELEEKERQEKKKKEEIEEKERLEKEKQKAKEMAEELELKKKKQLEELQKQEQERQKQIKEEKERKHLEEEIKLKEKKKKLELEDKEKERLEKEKQKEKDEKIRIQKEKEDDERRKRAIEQKKLKEREDKEIKLKEEKERLEKEKEKEIAEKMKLEKQEKIKTKLEETEKEKEMERKREKEKEKAMEEEKKKIDKKKVKADLDEKKIKEDKEKEKERIKIEQKNYQEEKLRHNEKKEKEKENQTLLKEEMKKEKKKENEKQSQIGELHLDKAKENKRSMNNGGIQEFNRGVENLNEVKLKNSTFKEKIIKEVKDIEIEALELEEILKKESNFREIVPSACQALNDDIKFNKKEIRTKTFDTIRGSKMFDEECNDWKVSKSKNIIFEDDDTEESSEISDQISISESSSMDMIEEKITNRWRGITPLKDLSVSEEMKKLEEEKIKMEKERRLKSIQRKRKIQKENARMEQRRLKELETLKQIEQDNERYENERRQKEIDMLRILKEAQEDIEKSEKQLDKKNKRRPTDMQKDFDEEMSVIKELEYNRLKKEMRQNEIQKNFDDEIKEIRERRFKRDIDRQKQEEEEEKNLIGNNFKSEDKVNHKGISKMKEDGEEEFMHFLISQQGKTIENEKKVNKYDQEVNVLYNTLTEDSQDMAYLGKQEIENGCKFLEKSPTVRKSKLLNEVVDNMESFAVGDINMNDRGRKKELKRNEELYFENSKFEDERRKRKQQENIQLLKEREKIEQKLIDLRNMEQYEDEIKMNINDEIDQGKVESVNESKFDEQIFETELERIKKKKRELDFFRKEQLEEEKSKIEEQRRIKDHEKKLKLEEEKQNIEKKLNNLENLYRLDSPESCINNDDQIEEDICNMDISTLINMPVNKEFDQNFEIELERIKKKRSELDSIRKEQLADEKNKIEELRKVKNQERNKKLQEEKENIEKKLCDLEKFNRVSGQEKFTDVPDEIEEENYNIDESTLDNVKLLKDLDEERLWIEESKKNKELKRKEQLELENIKREEERKFRHAKEIKKLEDEVNKIEERRLRDLKTIKNLEDENQSLEKEIGDNKLEIAKRIQDETFQKEEQIFLKNRNRIKEEEEDRARIERRKREIELEKQKLFEDEKKIMEEEKILNSLKRKKRQEEEQARIDQRRYKELEKIKLLEEENQRLESKKMKEIEVLKKLEYEQKKIMEEKKRIELQKEREKEEEFERIQKEKLQKRIDEQLEIEMEHARIQKEKKLKYIEKQKQLAEENEKIEKEKREKDMQFHEQLSKEIAIVENNKLEQMEKLKQFEEDRKQLEEKKRKDKEEKEKLIDIANDKYKTMQRTKELQKLEKENLRIDERRLRDLKKIEELENESKKLCHEKLKVDSKDNSHIEEIDKRVIMTNETEIKPFKQNKKDDKEDKHKEKIKSCVEEKETLSKLNKTPSVNVATMLDSENHEDNEKLSSINKPIMSNASITNAEKIPETKDKDFEIKNRMESGIKYSEFNTTNMKEGVIEKAVMSKQLNMTSNNEHKTNLDKTISKKDNCNSSKEILAMEDGNLNIEHVMETKPFNISSHINENGLEIQNQNDQKEKKSTTDMEKDIISKNISPTKDVNKLLEKVVTTKPLKQSPHPIEKIHENSNECSIMEKKNVQEAENNKISTNLVNRDDKKIDEKHMESSFIENTGVENKEISQKLPTFENSDTILPQQSNSKEGYMVADNDKSNLDNKKNKSVEKPTVLLEQENVYENNSIDKQKESIVDLIFESDIGDSDLIRNKMQQVVHEPCTSTNKKLSEHNIQRAKTVSQFVGSSDKSESVIENSKSSPTLSTHTGIQINKKEIFHISESYKCDKESELPVSDKNSDSNPDSMNNDTSRTKKDCCLIPDLKGNDIRQASIERDVIKDHNQTMFQSDIDSSCTRKDDQLPKVDTDSSPSINSPPKNIPSDSKQQPQFEEKRKFDQNSNNSNEIPNTQPSLHEQVSPSCDNVQILSTPCGRLQEILTSSLPDEMEDPEFHNRIQVFNNYKQFGAMYASKNNWKKAEWAYATGIKQVTDADKPAKSKHQLQTVLQTEVEFRIQRASALQALGRVSEAVSECRTVLTIDQDHQEAGRLIRSLQSNIYDARPSGR